MTPETALHLIIIPTTQFMGARYASRPAWKLLLAIGLQESKFQHRAQIQGPARGYWQFEKNGGVKCVLTHKASKDLAAQSCAELNYPATADAVYDALPDNPVLACVFARQLLFTDAEPLPTTPSEAWTYYTANWRPGKPKPATWAAHWKTAEQTL